MAGQRPEVRRSNEALNEVVGLREKHAETILSDYDENAIGKITQRAGEYEYLEGQSLPFGPFEVHKRDPEVPQKREIIDNKHSEIYHINREDAIPASP